MEGLNYNYAALILSIIKKITPERAFLELEKGPNAGRKTTLEEILVMKKMREQGHTYDYIALKCGKSRETARRLVNSDGEKGKVI